MYKIIVSCLGVAVIAYVIAMVTTQTAPRYVAMMLLPSVCSKSWHPYIDTCKYMPVRQI
jgi:hypothetical protein